MRAHRAPLALATLVALSVGVLLWPMVVAPRTDVAASTSFKQDHRLSSLVLQYATDAFATHNSFGSAIAGSAIRTNFQIALSTSIANGTTTLLLRFLGLNDLTGTNEPGLTLGVVNGAPMLPAGNPATYNGASDLDWWYSQNAAEIDANAVPKVQLTGSIASNQLTVGPGSMLFNDSLTGPLALSSTRISAVTGAVSTPLTSSNGFPPGHLPSEMIPPSFQSFASMSAGKLAGNISAFSLAAAPIPSGFATGPSACSEGYSTTNTWLDVLVGGCHVLTLTEIAPTQPDQTDPAAPVAGAGAPYLLTRTGNSVTGCKDKNATVVNLSLCLNAAAYSAYFQFTTDRVIVISCAPATDPDCNSDTDFSNPGAGLPCVQDHIGDTNNDGYSDADAFTPPGVPTCTGAYPASGGLGLDPAAQCAGRNLLGTPAQVAAAKVARADVDVSGKVNILDLAAAASAYGQSGFGADPSDKRNEFDQDGNGVINILDLAIMAAQYNQLVPPC